MDSLAARTGDIFGSVRRVQEPPRPLSAVSDPLSAKQLLTLVLESVIKLRLQVFQQHNAFGTTGQAPDTADVIDRSVCQQVNHTQNSMGIDGHFGG